jgi:two-component system NtrC family sensor kinase
MISRLKDVSLRVKIMVSFVLIVLGGTLVSTLIGSRIVTSAMRGEALKEVRRGLETAGLVYTAQLEDVRKAVSAAASQERLVGAAAAGHTAVVQQTLSDIARDNHLDFLTLIDTKRGQVVRPGSAGVLPTERLPVPDLVSGAVSGAFPAATEVFEREALLRENETLADRAAIQNATGTGEGPSLEAGLVFFAAAPVRLRSEVTGAIYGGVLLNRNHLIIDRIVQLNYGGEQRAGTVSIFLGDARVSTNVAGDSENRAVGTRVSTEVSGTVLARGERWYGRVSEFDAWHMAAYQPIRNHAGRIVGILSVSLQEDPFLAVRTDMMLTFLAVAVMGVLVVVGLTYLITRSMIHPLEEMVAASNRIAAGDLDHSVNVRSRDEIGLLAGSFNKMLASIKTMKLELEEWGGTLEEKVKKRTEELVAVQTQMAQSEKLASIGRLAAGVAHEINNPLGGILTFSSLALEECSGDNPVRQNLELIVKQTLRCRETVKGLLDFARQSSTAVTFIDVNAIVDKTLSLLENQSIFHDIRIVRQPAADLPNVLMDAGQLQQVVVNIVLNAVDAMEESGTLTVETAAAPQTEEVLLRISDTGKGIPDSVLPFIFEPFFTTKKVGHGTGLGLSIVHGIVTRAGGKIEVATSSKGTSFTVRFPILKEGQTPGG